jgi:hypothetical protein
MSDGCEITRCDMIADLVEKETMGLMELSYKDIDIQCGARDGRYHSHQASRDANSPVLKQ